ncbi:MAG: dUTP diphosphatase [Patescibacteria group bacterium]
MIIKIKKIKKGVKLPSYAYPGDAGLDLYSLENLVLKPGELHIFPLGFIMEIPKGSVALIWDRGGLGAKGLKSLGGVYDSGYRGEYSVTLQNISKKNFSVKKGDRIAQALIQPVFCARIKEVNKISPSLRGEGRHGSTGR